MEHPNRVTRAPWKRRGIAILGAAVGLLLLPTPADSQGTPPENPGTCPSHDDTVVIQGGRAYRWADFAADEVRLVSYQFKPGTFPPDPLTYEPTYPQAKFDIDWGWGCLSVTIPECGQVDTTVIGFNPPGTLRFQDAMAAITGGQVLAGSALLGTIDDCACPEQPQPPGLVPAGVTSAFSAHSGGPPEPEPCEPLPG